MEVADLPLRDEVAGHNNRQLPERLAQVRAASVAYCEPLELEDYGLQAMPETSPPKWHLAHTTWFFETFILKPYLANYQPLDHSFEVLFNSYYNGIGAQHPRAERGLLSRPGLDRVLAYRQHVNEHLQVLLAQANREQAAIEVLVELGIHHEQQHQELFFTDLKYSLSRNPLLPAYREQSQPRVSEASSQGWLEFAGGETRVGYAGQGFCFDNEQPRHSVLLQDYALADQPVSNTEYLAFMADNGYLRPELWLSDGWTTVQQQQWSAPLYWQQRDGQWFEYTLYGLQPLDLHAPVCHLSAYEADAYARWSGARLPSEFEWEAAASLDPVRGQFIDDDHLHPCNPHSKSLYGGVWIWTCSAYNPYPNFAPASGAIGEYNGKFMANQLVLRGGSCVSSRDHLRASYRNFFYPPDRWQFTGLRLAKWL
jgi:ergothioneine biosynthesis protein EgtB